MNINTKNKLSYFLSLSFGALLIALSLVIFFIPNNITTGGTPGIAILIYKLTQFPISNIIICINIPLLILGIKYLGRDFTIKTILTLILMSVFIELLKGMHIPILTTNIFLSSIFGGVVIGFGVGFIIKGNSSAGGSTIIARIISSKTQMKPSEIILIVDTIIVLSSIYVFNDFEKAFWSILSIYATIKAIDVVLTGTLSTKVVHIATSKAETLSKAISENLGEYGTILKGSTLLNHEDKTIIFIVVDVKKINLLRQIIEENDENAFMIIMEASQIAGRGH